MRIRLWVKKLAGNRQGATAIEYGLIAGLVAVAIVTGVTTVGTNLSTIFANINTKLAAVTPAA